MKKIPKPSSTGIVMIVIIVGFAFSHFTLNNEDLGKFEDYASYRDSFITGIAVAFGLLGIVTMYYLGKYHDYSLEAIKVKNEFEEYRGKLKSIKKFKFEQIEFEKQKERDDYLKTIDRVSDKLSTNVYSESKLISQSVSTSVLRSALVISALYIYGLVIFLRDMDDSNWNSLLLAIITIVSGLALFLTMWVEFESLLKRLINILDESSFINTKLKISIYDLEQSKI